MESQAKTKAKAPPTAAALAEWRGQLEAWVEGKLAKWDSDPDFRAARQQKTPTREEYEAGLREKVKAQIAAKTA